MYRIAVEQPPLLAEANILENLGPPVQAPGQMRTVAPPNNASNHARRIGHVLGSIGPDSGGPATVVCRLAAAQAALGHHVTIISNLPESARSDFALSTQNIPGFDRVRLLISPWTTPMRRWFGARLLPLYHSLFNYLDVVHIHGVWEPMLLVAASHARKINLPYIVRPCGMLDPWNLESHGWKKKLALSLSHRRMLNGAAILHMLNHDEDRLVASLRLKPRRLVIPNAVFLNEVDDTSGDKEFAALFPQLRDQPYILFLGRLHQKKGLDILIEAFGKIAERHPTLQLLIVGPDGGMRSETLKRAAELNLAGRVHLPGALYGSGKFAAYRHATCFCLPSRQEGFSLSITESLASRTPVVISEGCHFPEVAECGAGEVVPLGVDTIAAALERVLAVGPERRRTMGEAGRSLVEQNFTWDRVAEMTLHAYASVAPPSAARSAVATALAM